MRVSPTKMKENSPSKVPKALRSIGRSNKKGSEDLKMMNMDKKSKDFVT